MKLDSALKRFHFIRWFVFLLTLVTATGWSGGAATNSFTANGGAVDLVNHVFDGNGNVTQRQWVAGGVVKRTQTLTWDAFDRLISVTDRDPNNSGLNFVSVYDALGRRVRTIETLVTNGTPIIYPASAISTVDSWYDPQVEFLQVGVVVNGFPTTMTYGPDASGVYGGMQGVGGLEEIHYAGDMTADQVVKDGFGNVLGSISSGAVTWNPARYSSYGPATGYQPPSFTLDTTLGMALGWRGQRIDPTGIHQLAARPYDPVSGRFLSADPLGHGGAPDLYSYCGGDPVNRFDPTGRFGKQTSDAATYEALAGARDYVAEAHFQEAENQIGSVVVNLATFGIADPILALTTGYGFDGKYQNKSQAAENLYIAGLLFLPNLIPFAGQGLMALRGGTEAVIDAGARDIFAGIGEGVVRTAGADSLIENGERGLVQATESVTERGASATVQTSTQLSEHLPSSQSVVADPDTDVSILKSIRRYTERLVEGDVTSVNPATMARVRAIQRSIQNDRFANAGTGFHSLNFGLARDAQSRGFLQNLNIDRSIPTPNGFLTSRRPDYNFGTEIFDLKPWRPSASAYDATEQFLDIQGATGILPIPLYYKLW